MLNKMHQARWNAAQRIGCKVEKYLSQGYLVQDGSGEAVLGVVWTGFDGQEGLSFKFSETARDVYFVCDPEWDEGLYDTIADFRAKFQDWRIVHPKHLKKL